MLFIENFHETHLLFLFAVFQNYQVISGVDARFVLNCILGHQTGERPHPGILLTSCAGLYGLHSGQLCKYGLHSSQMCK